MKRTDLERRERDLRKQEKKLKIGDKEREAMSVGYYIDEISSLFRYDSEEIFNTNNDEKILELLENMKLEIPEKKWDDVIRKAVNKTKVATRERAIAEIKTLIGMESTN